METDKSIILDIFPQLRSELLKNRALSYYIIIECLLRKNNLNRCLLLLLNQYLEQKFSIVSIFIDFERSGYFPNDTMIGLLQILNHSEVDSGVQPVLMYENVLKAVDFTYPYKLNDHTFVRRKYGGPGPEIFQIFQCFTLPVRFRIAFIFITTTFVRTMQITG